MIEVVYKNNTFAAENRDSFKIPKNVTQIGNAGDTKEGGDGNTKIYIENSVMEELERERADFSAGSGVGDVTYGVLLGDLYYDDADYIFVRSIIRVNQKEIQFNDDVWREIYENIKERREESQILGWYATAEDAGDIELSKIRKIHLDNFAGNSKLFLKYDRQYREAGIYFYDHAENIMAKQSVYYIYWGSIANGLSGKMAGVTAGKEMPVKSGNRKIPRLLSKSEKSSYRKGNEKPEQDMNGNEKNKGSFFGSGKNLPWGSIAIIAILVGTLIYMGNNGQLIGLRNRASSLVNNIVGGTENSGDDYSFLDKDKNNVSVSDINANISSSEQDTTVKEPDTTSKEQNTTPQDTTPEATTGDTAGREDESDTAQVSGTAGKYYTVKSGQSLFDIARENYTGGMHELNVKVREIVKINNIENPDKIYPGQKIMLP